MHVAINATCRRGLRIIDEVPDINLCKIEGYNGIGKTSAIRLLQICTGQQPFNRNSLAWRTFRDQLVRANVKITGLTQADDIEWQIEPARDWPKLPEVLDETIGSIRVNSKQATMADVRSLLEVQHLYTTETPEKILSAQAEFAASTIDRWFYEDGQSRAQQLDRLIARAARLVSEVPTNQIRLARDVAEESKTAALHVANRTSVLRTRVERLDRAVQIADQLDTVRGTSPLLVAQLQEAMDQLAALDDHRNRLTEAISQAQLRRHLDEQAQETLAKAEKLLERRNRSLQRLRQELNHAALKANVSPVGELVAHAIVTMRSELDSLVEAQPLASVAPSLLAILSGILRYLDEAMALDLTETTVIDPGPGYDGWTVGRLREAIQAQIERVAATSPSSDVEVISRRITDARKRLDALQTVSELLKSAERAERLVREAENSLVGGSDELAHNSTAHLDKLLKERNDRDREGRELHSRIDRLQNELALIGGGRTEEALAAELDSLARQLDVEPARVRAELDRARQRLEDAVKEETQAALKAASADRQFKDLLAVVESTIEALAVDDDLAWLRRAEPTVQDVRHQGLDEKLSVISEISARLNEAGDLLESTVASTQGIAGALHELSARIQGTSDTSKQSQFWTRPVGQWLGDQGRRWLDDEIMREALFGGGHDVSLDIDSLSVSWKSHGEQFDRPLAAFSSGEQTFAFTRARLAQLEANSGNIPNRIIAIDEFGAYLDIQRFSALVRYLHERRERVPTDQVLVILPWGTTAPADVSSRAVARRQRDLARRGYFAEALDA